MVPLKVQASAAPAGILSEGWPKTRALVPVPLSVGDVAAAAVAICIADEPFGALLVPVPVPVPTCMV